jgi:hypothetical protein
MRNSLYEEDFIATLLAEDEKKEPTNRTAGLETYNKKIKNKLNPLIKMNPICSKDQIKNHKLVSILKGKMFKGFMKVKGKVESKSRPELRPISAVYVAGKRYNVKMKSNLNNQTSIKNDQLNFLKIEKYPEEKLHNLKDDLENMKGFDNRGMYKKLFITDKIKPGRTDRGFFLTEKEERDERDYKVFRQIFNNNLDEAKHYNSVSFLAFDVKRPNNHSGNNNKSIIEKEILREIENINKNFQNQTANNMTEQMGKTTKSDKVFKVHNFEKYQTKKCYMNYYNNPKLIKGNIGLGSRQAKSAHQFQSNKQNMSEQPLHLTGTNFNKTQNYLTARNNQISVVHSKNDSIYEFGDHIHSNFFTTGLNMKSKSNSGLGINTIFLKNTQKENYIKNFENIKLIEKLRKKEGSSSISCLPFEYREDTLNLDSHYYNIGFNRNNSKDETISSNVRPGTQSCRSKNENRLTTCFEDDILSNSPGQRKTIDRLPKEKNHIISILEKKKKFKELKNLAFSSANSADGYELTFNQTAKDFKRINTECSSQEIPSSSNSQRVQKLKLQVHSNQTRDYKVTQELYKVFEKEDVNKKIYGKNKI